MELLIGLGVNQTFWFQFAAFLIAYLILHFVLFVPYFRAYEERIRKTEGQTDLAERYLAESQELQAQYEIKARELNSEIKGIYDQSRVVAQKEQDRVIQQARSEAKSRLESSKATIRDQAGRARVELKAQVAGISQAITEKLLGKETLQ
jgi:F-type H+-transporting ATPase subunit b